MSYAKSTAVSIKGEYCKKSDLPSSDRYQTVTKMYFDKPKVRSEQEEEILKINEFNKTRKMISRINCTNLISI